MRLSKPSIDRLKVIFREDANPDLARLEFRLIGLSLPEDTLKSKFLMLSTLKSGLAPNFIIRLRQDRLVSEAFDYRDYLNSMQRLIIDPTLKTKEDKDYIHVNLTKLISLKEAEKWLEQYPGLIDEGMRQIGNPVLFTPMVNAITGDLVMNGGATNGWNYSLNKDIYIPYGTKEIYLQIVRSLNVVKKVNYYRIPIRLH